MVGVLMDFRPPQPTVLVTYHSEQLAHLEAPAEEEALALTTTFAVHHGSNIALNCAMQPCRSTIDDRATVWRKRPSSMV